MEEMKIIKETGDSVIDIAFDTIRKGKQALVFVGSKRSAEKQAEDIGKKIKRETPELVEISEKILNVLAKPTKQCERLSRCVRNGAAFHHAGLTQKQRDIIETAFRESKLKLICCTPTLAAGVDLPAFRAVIKDYRRFTGKFGMSPIPVLEYLQMAGRAGRPKFDKFGESILIAKNEDEHFDIYNRYVKGEPEDIYSKLAVEPVLRTSILSLIATEFVKTREQIMEFFGMTFWAYQYQDVTELEDKIGRMLALLEDWEFIKKKGESSDFVSADSVEDESYEPTLIGKRVSQLYLDPLTAHEIMSGLQKASSKEELSVFSFFHMVCSALEMRPRLRVKNKEFELIENAFAQFESMIIAKEPDVYDPEYDDFLDAIKTALMLNDWTEEKSEEDLFEEYGVRPGEMRVKIDNGDWLLYCAEELSRLMNFHELIKFIRRSRTRLKYGVKDELIPLLKLKGVGRSRARKMFSQKLHTLEAIKKIDAESLSRIVGPGIATKIKEQLGQKVDKEKLKIPKGTRKGQLSLNKFNK